MTKQKQLFETGGMPKGLLYQENFVTKSEEKELLGNIRKLHFENFQYYEYTGKRRSVVFGYQYKFGEGKELQKTIPISSFLEPLKHKMASFSDIPEKALVQSVIVEYIPGAGIGWHRDLPFFGEVVGLSLLSEANFRFRKVLQEEERKKWQRYNLLLPPRSIYVIREDARKIWQHSIPSVNSLRYSITFRTLQKMILD